jgi:transcriptional regulator with XRE-family HTH domain
MPSVPLTNYLRTHRKRAGLSEDDVAFLLGSKSGARISRYEQGRQTPRLKTLLAFELLFHTPIRDLYSGMSQEVERDLRQQARLLIRKLSAAGQARLTVYKIAALRAVSEQETSSPEAL